MANVNLAQMALDGGDPREKKNPNQFALDHGHESELRQGNFSVEAAQVHNDPEVLFEEYLHYAKITRAEEHAYEGNLIKRKEPWSLGGIIKNRFSKGHKHENEFETTIGPDGNLTTRHNDFSTVTDAEWRQASRAVRTASWGSIFFLITTDILGPSSAAYSFANTGYGPGAALYAVFGLMASISGWYVWGVYMHMDSDRYPLRDFGQAFFRVFGPTARNIINVLQSVQMIMLVAVLILSNGGSISEISVGDNDANGNGLCYIGCMAIVAVIGMTLGQIRTLQRFGWLANLSVWTTVTVAFLAIGASATGEPNYAVMLEYYGEDGVPYGATNFPNGTVESHIPIRKFAGVPDYGYQPGGTGFAGTYAGLNLIIYAYGGAMLFFNLLAEMRNPWDFWKGMLVADIFIFFMYMFIGLFQYSYQGQYTYAVNYQSVSQYNLQTAGNILSIVGGMIAAALYGNIGIKVVYNNVFVDIFHLPPLTSKMGKLLWIVVVPMYWMIGYIIAASIPEFSDFSSLVGAFCIGNFTYTFPALLKVGFEIKKAAMLPEESFDDATKKYVRVDSGLRRWARGYRKSFVITTINIIYFLGALVVCGMGMWSAIEALMTAFSGGSVATSWTCTSPFA